MFVLTISTLGFNRATERERSTYRCLISNIDKQTGSPLAVQSRPSWAVCLSLKFPASQHPNIPASQHPNIPTSQHPSSNPSAGLSSISFLIAALHLPVGRLVTCWAKRLTNANANNYTSSDISWMQLWFELITLPRRHPHPQHHYHHHHHYERQRRWQWRCLRAAGFSVAKTSLPWPKTSSSGSQLTLCHLKWPAGDPDTSENKIPIQIAPSINLVPVSKLDSRPYSCLASLTRKVAWPEPELEVRNQMHVSNGPAADAASASWEIKL